MTGEQMVRPTWERVLPWIMFAAFAVLIAIAAVSLATQAPRVTLKERLAIAAQAPAGTVVDIASISGFPWNSVHVFEPGTGAKQADEQLGFAWFESDRWRLFSLIHESTQSLVFVANGCVVADLSVGMELIAPGRGIPRAKAKFVSENGRLRWQGPD